jgi:hypothetical protein
VPLNEDLDRRHGQRDEPPPRSTTHPLARHPRLCLVHMDRYATVLHRETRISRATARRAVNAYAVSTRTGPSRSSTVTVRASSMLLRGHFEAKLHRPSGYRPEVHLDNSGTRVIRVFDPVQNDTRRE